MYGVVLDVETTGLDANEDQIIEIGLIRFRYYQDKCQILDSYSGLRDPGHPLSEITKRLTGIADDMVEGRGIDDNVAMNMIGASEILVAHNAAFDRRFVEAYFPNSLLQNKLWGCSIQDIDWKAKGHTSLKLNHLCADQGFLNNFAHRALFDCAATLRLVEPHLAELIKNAQQSKYRIQAFKSDFELKDLLKSQGYRWNVPVKVWEKIVPEDDLDIEIEWLELSVYGGQKLPSQYVSLFDPYQPVSQPGSQ